ncbi:MAG: hypothetical protein N5P05_000027 [Chroococcopsis gigantea SAG 12.99]|nr:hypothetical protein [Chroococcopsis gigantea SAG 12.99]
MTLKVILDMTSIEKTGKFKGLGTLMRVHNGTFADCTWWCCI